MSGEQRQQLDELAGEVAGLETSPLYAFRRENGYSPVFGEGSPEAQVMFVGEAPGRREAETGRPFVGRAGELLDVLLGSIGLARAQVYITNIVKDRPPQNRDPRREEIAIYAPFLRRQIEIIRPGVIATLGRFAMEFMLVEFKLPQRGQKIGALHGQPLEAQAAYGRVVVLPLYHPAATFYNRGLEAVLREDFEVLRRELGM